MLSLSDVKRYINESPAVNRFKPWWEVALDLLLAGMFITLMLSWSRLAMIESGGLVCIQIEGRAFSVGIQEARYIQSRCFMESPIAYFEFYPYIVFLQWGFIFLFQITWVWIPSVVAKFKYFNDILQDLMAIEPVFIFNSRNLGFLPEIEYTEENKIKLKLLHDKIIFMLMDGKKISNMYASKIYAVMLIVSLSLILTICWVMKIGGFKFNFPCNLYYHVERKHLPPMACSTSGFIFIYGIVILNILILILMLTLSIRGFVWHLKLKNMLRSNLNKLTGEFEDNYEGLPGYEDLIFLIELCKDNVSDGRFMLVCLLYLLNAKYKNNTIIMVNKEGLNICDQYIAGRYSFWEEWNIVNILLRELGLEITNYNQSPNALYTIISEFYKPNHNFLFDLNEGLREKIKYELIENYQNYSILIKNVKKVSIGNMIEPNYSAETYKLDKTIKDITDQSKWPNHIILQAAANIFKLKFVLVTTSTPDREDIFSYDIIEPFIKGEIFQCVKLTYIKPHYYYTMKNASEITTIQLKNQSRFASEHLYRDRLKISSLRKFCSMRENQESSPLHPSKHLQIRQEAADYINHNYLGTLISDKSGNSRSALIKKTKNNEYSYSDLLKNDQKDGIKKHLKCVK